MRRDSYFPVAPMGSPMSDHLSAVSAPLSSSLPPAGLTASGAVPAASSLGAAAAAGDAVSEAVWQVAPRRACAALPGCGGRLKAVPEDFVVEEVPAYTPSGTGEHLFLWLEKRGMPAHALVAHVARCLGVAPREVGSAGLKDTQAITRQYLSVPARGVDAAALARLDDDRVRLLHHGLHGNKLKTGHLHGNRFQVRLRGVAADGAARAATAIAHLQAHGLPNYYGPQRFGQAGDNVARGRRILAGDRAALRDVPQARHRMLRRLCLSALQSALFNAYLAERLGDDLLQTVLEGDVLGVRASGGVFVSDDAAVDQARLQAGELVVTGPMFGVKMRAPSGAAAAREAALLAAAGLSASSFASQAQLMQGSRRPLTIWPTGLTCVSECLEMGEPTLLLSFTLPPGCYATVLLEELMGPPA